MLTVLTRLLKGDIMINDKMKLLGEERSKIRELFEYGIIRKSEIGEDNVYDFSLGNPSIPCPDEVTDALKKLITSEDPTGLHGYTSAPGDSEVRRKIAEHLTRVYGTNISKDDLYMTVGAAAALTATLNALVTPGEEVIVLAPYFPEYKVFIEACGGVIIEVKCQEKTFEPQASDIAKAINEKTAAIIVNSPNNPTGAVFTEECIASIAEVLNDAKKRYQKDIYLIADEPYRELVYDSNTVPFIPSYYEDTIVCYSYSKSLSIPGERIGYCMVSPTAKMHDEIYAAICGAGRSLGYVCAPSLLQKMIPMCLGKFSDIEIYDRNRKLLFTKLTEYGYELVNPQGAFYLFVKSPVSDAKIFSEAAKKHEILIVPSDSFGYPGYVRISYCVKTEIIEKALPSFRRLAEEFGLIKR